MAMPQSQLSVIHAARRELWYNIHQKIDDPKHCLKLKLPLQNSYEAKTWFGDKRRKILFKCSCEKKMTLPSIIAVNQKEGKLIPEFTYTKV